MDDILDRRHEQIKELEAKNTELEKNLEIACGALSNWIKWEDEQIKRNGSYSGFDINVLINQGKQALAAINGEGV